MRTSDGNGAVGSGEVPSTCSGEAVGGAHLASGDDARLIGPPFERRTPPPRGESRASPYQVHFDRRRSRGTGRARPPRRECVRQPPRGSAASPTPCPRAPPVPCGCEGLALGVAQVLRNDPAEHAPAQPALQHRLGGTRDEAVGGRRGGQWVAGGGLVLGSLFRCRRRRLGWRHGRGTEDGRPMRLREVGAGGWRWRRVDIHRCDPTCVRTAIAMLSWSPGRPGTLGALPPFRAPPDDAAPLVRTDGTACGHSRSSGTHGSLAAATACEAEPRCPAQGIALRLHSHSQATTEAGASCTLDPIESKRPPVAPSPGRGATATVAPSPTNVPGFPRGGAHTQP